MHIGVLIGSLRKDSYNRKVFATLQTYAPADVVLSEIPIDALPLYNKDIEDPLPTAVQRLKTAIEEKDAIIFISPEYNRSVPGVLKNAIDWSTRGGNYSLDKKPGAVIGATVSRLGTAPMQAHMKNVMLHVGMRVIGQPEVYIAHADQVFDEHGTLSDEKVTEALKRFIHIFIQDVRAYL